MEIFLEYGWVLIVIAIVFGVFSYIVSIPDDMNHNIAAENFCRAWSEERGVTYIDGDYSYFIPGGQQVDCQYSFDSDVFDGGVSLGPREHKYFNISEEALLEWVDKGKSKDCCEVC